MTPSITALVAVIVVVPLMPLTFPAYSSTALFSESDKPNPSLPILPCESTFEVTAKVPEVTVVFRLKSEL